MKKMINLKNIKFIGILLQVIAYVLAFLLIFTKSHYLGYTAIILLGIDGVILFLFWRCPKCNKNIGPLWTKCCSNCGEKIL